jgi:NAD(P)-dependent dehydrogenase (short-subunit alcohol dehydrogenase family)
MLQEVRLMRWGQPDAGGGAGPAAARPAGGAEAAAAVAPGPLAGRVALVTGASRGIGRAIALALARAGADVALSARDREGLEATAAAAEAAGGRQATALVADLTSPGAPGSVVAGTLRAFGRLDVLVNNAGVNRPGLALDVTEADWDAIFDLNLRATFFVSQAAARAMAAGGGGAVVNVASIMGAVADGDRAPYCASKTGLVGLTRALALEWAPLGIRVNAVGPTWVETEMTRRSLSDPEFLAGVLARIPQGRLPAPEDVANAVVFLASPAAACITGQHLLVDGGWTAR